MSEFTHLHVHTRYSLLDGACESGKLIRKAKEFGMDAVAITDHGNMFGVLEFKNKCDAEGIKPILGCEMYVAPASRFDKNPTPGGIRQRNNHLVLLAKNFEGYQNLIKLDSLAFDDEAFYRHARIDKELLFQYHEGLICSSACLAGAIPQLLLNGEDEKAEKLALEYKEVFQDDYYIEIQNHIKNDEQLAIMPKLVNLARKLDIQLLATNDVHFINKDDYEAHKILICMNTGQKLHEYNNGRMSYTGEEWFKSAEDMKSLFAEYPEAIENTMKVADKIEVYNLERKPILPVFDIPESFGKLEDYYEKFPESTIKQQIEDSLVKTGKIKEDNTEEEKQAIIDKELKDKGGYEKEVRKKFDFAYLKHLTYEGAKQKYPEITPEIQERIDEELATIEWMGFPGYFLIVQDFINYSRDKLGVIIGPGRGSAAGSVVAYCLGITQIEPMKYDLLFERFLNPDRISLPDIDVDFDDEGRAKALKYVQDKYGKTHVAQITTFGSMAAKSAIKDVARVLEYPLADSNKLASYVPAKAKNLQQAIDTAPELKNAIQNGDEKTKKVLEFALKLEGSLKSTGVHACGVIIGPDDISNYVPLTKPKDSDMMATQFEGSLIESVGMIKMDFLGLSNLSIIKDTCENVKKSKGIDIDIANVPLDDEETLALFARGDTTGTFQFESEGMKAHLQNLKPDKFEDLIAMNALYRPGPMSYIPSFIDRKHGVEKIEYDIPIMEQYLSNTYGITVYQEQVMQISRLLAGFTRGQADTLRKAMGKKKKDLMDKLKIQFDEGCRKNGYDMEKVDKIWKDWEKFAEYAFNKSHSTCYAFIAFQTGYLKAHYTAEYMSALLTHNLTDLEKLAVYIADCQKHNLKVLGPNVNESDINFMVNSKGEIVFGLAAIKGVGDVPAKTIIEERAQNGPFKNSIDFITRVAFGGENGAKPINRKCIESLVKSGAFDCFNEADRAQYLFVEDDNSDVTFVDKLIKYAQKNYLSKNSAQISLFGEEEIEQTTIKFPECEPLSTLEKLRYEKEMISFFISGHPLDIYKHEINCFVHNKLNELSDENMESMYLSGKTQLSFGGYVSKAETLEGKNGNPYGNFTLEDKDGEFRFRLFGQDFVKYGNFLKEGLFIFVKGAIQERKFKKKDKNEPQTETEVTIYEFKIANIELLMNLFQNHGKSITIKIDTNKLNQDFITRIVNLTKECKGNKPIIFECIDYNKKMSVHLNSTKHKVDIHLMAKQLSSLVNEGVIDNFKIDCNNF